MTHSPPYLTPLVKIKFRPNLYMQPAGPADNDILFFGRFSPKLLFDISRSNFSVIKFLLYDNKRWFECGLLYITSMAC